MKIVNMHVKLRRAHHVEVQMTTSGTTVYLGSSVIGPRDDDFEKSLEVIPKSILDRSGDQ